MCTVAVFVENKQIRERKCQEDEDEDAVCQALCQAIDAPRQIWVDADALMVSSFVSSANDAKSLLHSQDNFHLQEMLRPLE